MSLIGLCRLCVNKSECTIYLEELLEKAELLLRIRLPTSDRLPDQVCKACESTINDFYNYQQRVCGNQERLTLELIKAEETALPTDIQGKDLPAVATGRDYDEGISTTDAANASDTGNSNISENAGEKFDGPDNDNISSDETEQQSLRKKSRVKKNVERKEKRKLQKKQEEDFILSVMPLTCPMCDSLSPDFDSFKAFADHFKTVHETTNWYIFCNLCRNQFRRPGHLYKHLKVHGDRNTIKCSICDKSFASNKSLAEHKKTHLPDDQKKFECEHCHRRFPNGSALAYHLENHIPVEQFQFECSQCGSTWPSKSRLNAHIHKVHSGQAFVCEICAQSYTARDGLRRHMDRKHLGKAPTQPKVKCPACDKILMNSKVFKVHFRAVHQEAGEYPCPECGHVSPNKRALKWHVEKAHKKKDIADCRACGKQMKSVRGFKEHMAGHSGNMLYECKFCPKEMNSNGNMYNHMKASHSAEFADFKRSQYEANAALLETNWKQ